MALDIMHCYEKPALERDEVLPGLMPGSVGSLIAPGATGKSFFALELSVLVATGFDLLGLNGGKTGPVAYLNAEDPSLILHERLHDIGKRLPQNIREASAARMVVEPLLGYAPDLLDARWQAAIRRLAEDKKLVVLDTLTRFHSVVENDEASIKEILRVLETIAADTGAAIVFAHHVSKSAIRDGTADAAAASRGSSVLSDNIRWQLNMMTMRRDEAEGLTDANANPIDADHCKRYVRVIGAKQSYTDQAEQGHWLERVEGGVLRKAELKKAEGNGKAKRQKRRDDI